DLVGLVDEIPEGVAGGDLCGKIADHGEAETVILQLLDEFAGKTAAQAEEFRIEADNWNGDDADLAAIGLADEIDRILAGAERRTVGGADQNVDIFNFADVHVCFDRRGRGGWQATQLRQLRLDIVTQTSAMKVSTALMAWVYSQRALRFSQSAGAVVQSC